VLSPVQKLVLRKHAPSLVLSKLICVSQLVAPLPSRPAILDLIDDPLLFSVFTPAYALHDLVCQYRPPSSTGNTLLAGAAQELEDEEEEEEGLGAEDEEGVEDDGLAGRFIMLMCGNNFRTLYVQLCN
jgi:hypothetical protein